MVRLPEILNESSIRLDILETEKTAVIRSLIGPLSVSGVVVDPEQVQRDILARERVMSTGIGGGIAVPHAQSAGVTRLAVALGRVARPIEFEALDERPVSLLFLVVGPVDGEGFIRVLARIGRLLYSGDLTRKLLGARNPAEAMEFIRIEEARITG
jgi:mannitol/fructose-specific phosphotransferase system IIA component (Ntr-type)